MKKSFILLLPLLLVWGCGVWTDFTTYFNVYYDASDNFNQAEQLIKEQKRDLFSTEEAPLPGSAGQLLNKVILKASKILQFDSSSSFVDNALLMLGKSLYYQKDYPKAIRKFQELITTRPKSGFILESRLWIGKSQMRMKQYDAGMKTLSDVRTEAVSKKEDDIFQEAYLEEIKYRVITEDFDLAISLINEFLKVSSSNDINAKVSYELGKLYYKQNKPVDAISAYQNVFNYSPSYDITLETRIELAKAYRKNGDPQKAVDLMQNMRKEIKYTDAFHRIDLEIALSLIDLKKLDEGIQALVKIDTTFAASTSAGLARFELGKIFETKIPVYDSAYNYYMKASVSTGSDPKMLLVANEKTQLFKKYQYIRSLIEDTKKQLNYIVNPEEFTKDSIAFYSDTIKLHQDELPGQQNRTPNVNDRGMDREDPRLNPNPVYSNTPKKRPPVHPVLSLDTLKANMVKNEFELGNIFFTELNRPDSAAFYYLDIINNYPASKYEARTLYSLGIYYETLNDTIKADSIYNNIYNNYRTEKVVNAAAQKLNKPLIDFEFDPAKNIYSDAETDMKKKDFNVSLTKFYGISEKYPKSPLAPKALFASGWILENDLKLYDSAAVVYDTLAARYPKSLYTSTINPKLYYYKEEIKKRKLALQDSLMRIEQANIKGKNLDSLSRSKDRSMINRIDSLRNKNGSLSDSLKGNNINRGIDSLNFNRRGMFNSGKIDSLRRNNIYRGLDSTGTKKSMLDSLKNENKKHIEP